MHPRNPHLGRYNFQELIRSCPELKPLVIVNQYGDESINFADPLSVMMLNKAILQKFYGVSEWFIPPHYLCPPIPGRADYIHYLADLLSGGDEDKIPRGPTTRGLDIGVGANCVYPLIGRAEYGWSFLGSDIDSNAVNSARRIIQKNNLEASIQIIQQPSAAHLLQNIIGEKDFFYFTMCNPPFHSSPEEAKEGTIRKLRNLGKGTGPVLNFGGQSAELWCEGGERAFILRLIKESVEFTQSSLWFTSLVSKEENLPALVKNLEKLKTHKIKIIDMTQGQKKSRILAWTFLTPSEHKNLIQKNK